MDPIQIDDARDPRVAAYLDIRERDLTGRHGRFVAEGKVVLDVLLSAGRFTAESVLVLENRLAGLDDILRKAPADLPVYVATSDVMFVDDSSVIRKVAKRILGGSDMLDPPTVDITGRMRSADEFATT